ncbi:MAG: hypothetical protein ACFHWZ_06915 [Phycisphaerales bacterium]
MSKPDLSDHDLVRATITARGFKEKGCPVFPGAIVAIRAGSYLLEPIPDEDLLVEPTMKVHGIALWGPTEKGGACRIVIDEQSLFYPAEMLDPAQPVRGQGRFLALLIRLVILGRITQTQTMSVTVPDQMTQAEVVASYNEIYRLIREGCKDMLEAESVSDRLSEHLATIVQTREPTVSLLRDAALLVEAHISRRAEPNSIIELKVDPWHLRVLEHLSTCAAAQLQKS